MTDPLRIMNAIMRWTNPPPMDERWEKKIAILCEYSAACRDLTFLRLKEINCIRNKENDPELKSQIGELIDKITSIEQFIGIY